MNQLKLSLVQPFLYWEDKKSNFNHLKTLIQPIQATDLIILPEMFSTGFSMNPQNHYEEENGEGLQWMKKIAKLKNAAVCGSLIVKIKDSFYNRFYFVHPDGNFQHYDKRHLFTLAGEHKLYSRGLDKVEIMYKSWKILPFVCYDLRFPVWCRNTSDAELMIFVANWPQRRSAAWKLLLKARAVENMCYVAGVNRIGNDGNGVEHSGDSALISELGETLVNFPPGEEMVETFTLSKNKVYDSRERFSFLNDRDDFQIQF